MPRILLTLAAAAAILLAITFGVGFLVESAVGHGTPSAENWIPQHLLLGVASALAVVFVHSLALTYFIGTTRWCKEVVEAYGLDRSLVKESTRLKRRSFPWSLTAVLVVVGIIALGAAADPATGRRNLEPWATAHLAAALPGLVHILWSFYATWNNVVTQHALIDRIVEIVRQVRVARGLDSQ